MSFHNHNHWSKVSHTKRATTNRLKVMNLFKDMNRIQKHHVHLGEVDRITQILDLTWISSYIEIEIIWIPDNISNTHQSHIKKVTSIRFRILESIHKKWFYTWNSRYSLPNDNGKSLQVARSSIWIDCPAYQLNPDQAKHKLRYELDYQPT